MTMKLVLISHSSECKAGGEKCLVSLIKGLKDMHPEWQLYLVIPSNGNKTILDICGQYLSGYKTMSLRWWIIDKKPTLGLKLSFIYRIFRKTMVLFFWLKKIRPDYCITNTIVIPYLAFTSKMAHIPHCWFIHEIPRLSWNQYFVFGDSWTYKLIDKYSFKILVPSEYTRQYYIDRNISGNKIETISQSVEINNTGGPEYKRRHSCYTIMMIATFDDNKGQMTLLQAINILVKRHLDIFCILAGSNTGNGIQETCDRYVIENGLSQYVEMLHFTEDTASLYKKADVIVICSRMETFGRTIAEAKIFGIPVIASRTGAIPEQITDGINGLLYEPGNITELADKIEKLSNPNERKAISENIQKEPKDKYSTISFATSFCNKVIKA